MQKTVPSLGRIAVMVGFAASCFGLLLFLWLAFGGPVPLKPKGYRITASFAEAGQLAEEADVRISGVPVGRVKGVEPDPRTGRSVVTLELASRYAPLPADARAVLRAKTLLGETYVELTPGTRAAPELPEGGRLADAQVSGTVELDEILRTFDPRTRRAFQIWMQAQAQAIGSTGRDLNDALGTLGPFAQDASELLAVLRRQDPAVRRLVGDTGVVFEALTERDGQLRALIADANRVFATTGRRDRSLREAMLALPAFERESRRTVTRLARFARDTDPLVDQLRPAARRLSPTLTDLVAVAPDLRGFLSGLRPVIAASRAGLPAGERVLREARPLLGQVDPAGRQLNPLLEQVALYRRELIAFLTNSVAATQATTVSTAGPLHYLRTTNPLSAENLAIYPRRIPSNRTNPYLRAGALDQLADGLPSYETRHCAAGGAGPTLTNAPTATGFAYPDALIADVLRFAFPAGNGAAQPAPPCRPQRPFGSGAAATRYPHVAPR